MLDLSFLNTKKPKNGAKKYLTYNDPNQTKKGNSGGLTFLKMSSKFRGNNLFHSFSTKSSFGQP